MKRKLNASTTLAKVRARASAEQREFGASLANRPMMLSLYRRAEQQLRKHSGVAREKLKVQKATEDPRRVLHELQVHQVELEMQNEELRQARNAMEAGLEKYSDLYDFAPISYLTIDRAGMITEANLATTQLLEIGRAALLKKRFGDIVRVEDRPAFAAYLGRLFESKVWQECDLKLAVRGGSLIDVRLRATICESGDACRVAVTDVTDRKRAEDQLRVSEMRYRRLFEAAHDGVLILDPATRKITDANPFMTRLLGYPQAQLIGKELFEIGLLSDEAASQLMFRQLRRTHQVRYEDLPLKSRTGRHQEVEVVANLYEEDGHPVIQCNIRDITERKLAEDALRRNEALFSALIEQAPVGVYVVDARFQMLQINREAQPSFARVRPLVGRDFSEIIHVLWPKPTADLIEKRFRHTLKTGRPFKSSEFSARRQDIGERQIFEWQIQRVTLPAGEYGVVCFFSNITERKRAEEIQRRVAVLAASNQKLEREIVRRQGVEIALKRSERTQRKLLNQSLQQREELRQLSRQVLRAQEEERKSISRELHDVIAQTLTGINVRLGALKKKAAMGTRDLDRNIARTQRMVEKSVEIVHQFARELRPAVLDDLGLIPALHSYMKGFTTRTGVRARLTAFQAVEQLDGTQRTVLYRVAQEALTNVARHAHASRVEVRIKKVPGGISMSIRDDGKSFRVRSTLSANGGKRLGLLGMRERVEMVGGKFTVVSTPGRGTSVQAEIPMGKVRSQSDAEPRRRAAKKGHGIV